jgi:hypothetical protein
MVTRNVWQKIDDCCHCCQWINPGKCGHENISAGNQKQRISFSRNKRWLYRGSSLFDPD